MGLEKLIIIHIDGTVQFIIVLNYLQMFIHCTGHSFKRQYDTLKKSWSTQTFQGCREVVRLSDGNVENHAGAQLKMMTMMSLLLHTWSYSTADMTRNTLDPIKQGTQRTSIMAGNQEGVSIHTQMCRQMTKVSWQQTTKLCWGVFQGTFFLKALVPPVKWFCVF